MSLTFKDTEGPWWKSFQTAARGIGWRLRIWQGRTAKRYPANARRSAIVGGVSLEETDGYVAAQEISSALISEKRDSSCSPPRPCAANEKATLMRPAARSSSETSPSNSSAARSGSTCMCRPFSSHCVRSSPVTTPTSFLQGVIRSSIVVFATNSSTSDRAKSRGGVARSNVKHCSTSSSFPHCFGKTSGVLTRRPRNPSATN